MSIPEQIRTLEELAGVDAELKVLDDQLSQERATLAALKASLKRLDEKRKNDLLSVGCHRQGPQRARRPTCAG